MRRAAVFVMALAALPLAPVPGSAGTREVLTAAYLFLPEDVQVTAGDALRLTNADVAPHDVVAVARTRSGAPLFSSRRLSTGESGDVLGVSRLRPGSYAFVCSLHPQMRGVVDVARPGAAT